MKKTALILAFAATTLALAGCGKKTEEAADAAAETAGATDEASDAAAPAPSAAASDTKMDAPVKK